MNLKPILYNFRIKEGEGGELNRVYFDSSKVITPGLDGISGFSIRGKTILKVTIISGALYDHYFELSTDSTHFSNILIKYTGWNTLNESTIQDDSGNNLYSFKLEYIKNELPEPVTLVGNYKYVEAGVSDDAGDGSKGNPWSIRDGYSKATAGQAVWMKAGDYGNVDVFVGNNGAVDNPIKFIGYITTEGDAPLLDRETLMEDNSNFNSADMPYMNGASPTISTASKKFIIMKNIQITSGVSGGADEGIIKSTGSSGVILHNVYTDGGDHGIWSYGLNDNGIRYDRCYVSNVGSSGYRQRNKNNLMYDCWAVTTKNSGMDYYLSLYGGNDGHSNAMVDCYAYRKGSETHFGHGLSFKGGQDDKYPIGTIEDSLILNCEAYNMRNAGLEIRHSNVFNNHFNNIKSEWENGLLEDGENKHRALVFRDGCHDNYVNNFQGIGGGKKAIYFYKSGEDLSNNYAGKDNTVANSVFVEAADGTRFDDMIQVINSSPHTGASTGNKFIHNVYFGGGDLVHDADGRLGSSNEILNSIVQDVASRGSGTAVQIKDSNFYENEFSTPSGNYSYNPNWNPFPIATNPDLDKGDLIEGTEYDAEKNERYAPATLGSFQIVEDYQGNRSEITWDNSIDEDVYSTTVFRDDVNMKEVRANEPSEWIDKSPIPGANHKYEVQSNSPRGSSEKEEVSVNVTYLQIPL